MRARSLDLVLAGFFAVVAAFGIPLMPEQLPWVRLLLTVPLVLLLPGYAVIAALLPRLTARAELAALSIAMSLAIAAISGVVLSLFGVALGTRSWALLLGGVTLFGVVVAALRRDSATAGSRLLLGAGTDAGVATRPGAVGSRAGRGVTLLQVALIGYAVVVAGVAVLAAPRSIAELPDTGTTQLWILPRAPEAGGGVRIGVANHEASGATYRLELHGVSEGEWPVITIEAGQTWEGAAVVPATAIGDLEAVLTRPDRPLFERHVVLRLPVSGG